MLASNCELVEIPLKIRKTQIILTFSINECIKKVKAECNQRAVLLNLIWLKNMELFKTMESFINEAVRKKEIELSEAFIQKYKSLENTKKSIEIERNNFYQKLQDKEEEIKNNL